MTLTLEVDGTEFTNFTDASASIAIDQFVNTFAFGAITEGPRGFPVAIGDSVRVLADGVVIVTGVIEGLTGSHAGTARSIEIRGASETSDVVDSTVNQIVLSAPVSLQSVIETVLGEIGSRLTVTSEVSDLADFEESDLIAAQPGQGAFDLMEQYARKRQVFVRTGSDGNILISRNAGEDIFATLSSRFDSNENNVKSASVTIDHSERFNIYIIRSQQNQVGLFAIGEDPGALAASDQSGEAIDEDIRASRTLTLIAENATDNDGLTERAAWEANVRRSRSLTYTPTVVGHSVNGTPWSVNQLVQVEDEWEGINAVMLIDRVNFQFSDSGSMTELRCVAPDAYTLQASEPQKQKQTDPLGGLFGE